ncbi:MULTISPECIES: hypothetical protein [unclassified Bradyrhizobium]|uniref:hypothetical protein n=1 Tax=unclassified Bradyrhizobium TaxID=2631580 RepID=UPI0028E1AD69|nr:MULTISPECIES: hypothetical protein [unclassified Bradyrhizobium]
MALPVSRPFYDAPAQASTASIGATPAAAVAVAPVSGILQRVLASAGGTTTGTIAVSVTINGGSDVTGGGLTIAAGTGARNNPPYELALVGAGATSGVYVAEGDLITFTPSGGGGASIPGAFVAMIRAF